MGCFISKPQKTPTAADKRLPLPTPNVSPLPRTVSILTPLVHHPPLRKGDSHHLVCLTSTTYGSPLVIESDRTDREGAEGSMCSMPARESKMTSLKQEKDSSKSLSPDYVINTWELMDGLGDCLPDEEDQPDRINASDQRSLSPLTQTKEVASAYLADKEYSISQSGKHARDNILLYYTSLRGVRKTYEDCCAVRMIFRGFGVHVDERDISMDSSYKKDLLGKLKGKKLTLPRVFIRGEHLGSAEEIKHLNENGELAKLLEGLPVKDSFVVPCGSCGEARFVPCLCCCGSRKVFDKASKKFRRCMDCNENGLIQCPVCCSN